ncbi:hypothetical protein ACFWBF_29430 [Streptomyces sp. NPDC060028]|uniref:hypothetical protein n=1 Tax=Streptomyces sp. NPDC060028 TaxID=3347041 RepID=UPI00368B5364
MVRRRRPARRRRRHHAHPRPHQGPRSGRRTRNRRRLRPRRRRHGQGWGGWNTTRGSSAVTEWAAQGTHSLRADVDLAKGETFLSRKSTWDMTDRTRLTVRARTAPWGDHAAGTRAKLYVRTGAGVTWYDDGARLVGAQGATLTLDLSKVAELHDVREIGVDFVPAVGATGTSAVYVDDLTVE